MKLLRKRSEKCIPWVLGAAAAVSAAAIIGILALLVVFCLPLFSSGRLMEILSMQWQPAREKFGILPMCAASLALALLSLGLSLTLAVGICLLLQILRNRLLARFFLALIRFMTGIPTVVYGFVSVFLLVPKLREWFSAGSGFSLLAAALVLSILLLPTIVLVIHSRMEQADPMLRLLAETMGFTPIQHVRHILLPSISHSLIAAAVLGFGRAMGDTMISLMLAGNAPNFPDSVFVSVRTLTAHIALVVATDSQSMAYQSIFAAGLTLFSLTGMIALLIRKSGNPQKERGFDKRL